MTEWLPFHFPLSCIGEGNGNPLQCSCLENPRDGGAWWASVNGVAQSRTQLKWLSSSSSSTLTRRRQWHPTSVLLPGESHGRMSLVGCSPWSLWGSDMTERLHFHFSLSCIGEGNGNPPQCSCLENLRDGGAWWAAVYGVAQGRTRLKWLSSRSSTLTIVILKNKTINLSFSHPPLSNYSRRRCLWKGLTGNFFFKGCKYQCGF